MTKSWQKAAIELNVPTTSPLFQRVAAEIGGFRQVNKTIAAIKGFEIAQDALKELPKGTQAYMDKLDDLNSLLIFLSICSSI